MSDMPAPPAAAEAPRTQMPASPPGTLGRVAMIGGIALVTISIAVAIISGIAAGPHAEVGPYGFSATFSYSDPDPAVRALALSGMLHVALDTLVGLWILIQGIVAVATRRGRAGGVVAIVLAAIAPGLSLAIYFAVMLANA